MKSLGFRRYALGISAAALLAGCGGSQPPIGAPGAMPNARRAVTQRMSGSTYTVKPGLLFVALTDPVYPYDDVLVYNVKEKNPKPIATIRDGVSEPLDACIDANRTLYVTNLSSGQGWISEYPLGSTSPLREISRGIDGPEFCAIDAHGNLWVTNVNGPNVTEYLQGSTQPHTVVTDGVTAPIGIAIDHAGNLYVSNNGGPGGNTNVQVYAPGGRSPKRTITDGVDYVIGIGVDAKDDLYVANAQPGNVEEYAFGHGKPYRTITEEINGPSAVTIGKNGWLYITNTGFQSGGSGPWPAVLEVPPGSLQPSKRMIKDGLYDPRGTAYYPPLLP